MCPDVSVVIPTFNRADSVARAIRSVLAQDWPAAEIIVVDDGSTDGTADVLHAFEADHPQTLRVISQTNHGVAFARNAGIRAAKHDFVAFLDSDDRWMPTKLSRQIEQFQRVPELSLNFTGYILENPNQSRVIAPANWPPDRQAVLEALLTGCCIAPSTVIARRDALVRAGLFDVALRRCEDHDLWLRMAAGGEQIGYVATASTHRHLAPTSLSSNTTDVARSTEFVFERLFASGTLPSVIQKRRNFYLARCYLNSACRHLDHGNPSACLASLWRAFRTRPLSTRTGWMRIAALAAAQSLQHRSGRHPLG
jgi:glycosyltransferase involved in cell wall biosynthesis